MCDPPLGVSTRSAPRNGTVFSWGVSVTRIERWCAACLSLALCVAAMARLGPESANLLGSLPKSIHAAILVEDAAALRRTPAGRALDVWLHEGGLFSETSEAWTQLSATMELQPQQAFDAMLGSSALIAIEFTPRPGVLDGVEMHWALVSRIDADFEKHLYERLKPAPRGVSGGRPVLSLENGRFELATTDSAKHRNPAGEPRVTAILAPASSSALFDKLVAGEQPAGSRLSDVPGFDVVHKLADNPIIAVLRGPLPIGEAALEILEEPASILAFGMRAAADSRWEASLLGDPALLNSQRPPAGVASLTLPRAAIRQIPADAMFVFAGATDGLGFSKFPGPLTAQVARLAGPTQDLDAMLGPRMLTWMESSGGLSGFAMSIGVQVSDVARAAQLGDAVFVRMLKDQALPATPDGSRLSKELNFQGLGPQAQRLVELRAADQIVLEGEQRAFMSWSYEATGPDSQGWWIASLARGSSTKAVSTQLDRLRAAVTMPAEAERDALSVVRLRPSAIMKMAGPAVNAIPILCALRQVDSVGWEVFLTEDGSARGTAWLEFAKPAAPSGPVPSPAEAPAPKPESKPARDPAPQPR